MKSLSAFHDTYDHLLTPTWQAAAADRRDYSIADAIGFTDHGEGPRRFDCHPNGVIDGPSNKTSAGSCTPQVANLTGRPRSTCRCTGPAPGRSERAECYRRRERSEPGRVLPAPGSERAEVTGAGLPLGVQFVGGLGSDGGLLALAAQLEQAAPWAHRYTGVAV